MKYTDLIPSYTTNVYQTSHQYHFQIQKDGFWFEVVCESCEATFVSLLTCASGGRIVHTFLERSYAEKHFPELPALVDVLVDRHYSAPW